MFLINNVIKLMIILLSLEIGVLVSDINSLNNRFSLYVFYQSVNDKYIN